jgi:hypothetical protein
LINRRTQRWRERKELGFSGSLEHRIAMMSPAERRARLLELHAEAAQVIDPSRRGRCGITVRLTGFAGFARARGLGKLLSVLSNWISAKQPAPAVRTDRTGRREFAPRARPALIA